MSEFEELVKRLRCAVYQLVGSAPREAADALEAQAARIAALEAQVKAFWEAASALIKTRRDAGMTCYLIQGKELDTLMSALQMTESKVWSDKAIEDALDAHWADRGNAKDKMRAALDAAAAVDGDAQWNAVLDEAHDLCIRQEESDIAYGAKYPDEALKQDIRAHRCRTLAAALLSLKRP